MAQIPPQKPPVRPPRRPRRVPQIPKLPGGGDSFWFNLATAEVVLLLLAGAYSYLVGVGAQATPDIPISQVAQDINAGKISSITIDGDTLDLTYADKTQKT